MKYAEITRYSEFRKENYTAENHLIFNIFKDNNLAKIYFGVEFGFPSKEDDVIGLTCWLAAHEVNGPIMVFKYKDNPAYWMLETEYNFLRTQLNSFHTEKIALGYINGLVSPVVNSKMGMQSAMTYDGYQFWVQLYNKNYENNKEAKS